MVFWPLSGFLGSSRVGARISCVKRRLSGVIRSRSEGCANGGAYGGVWSRTGYTFGVWTSGAGLYDVCRFFQVYYAPKSSHFYTPLDYECAGLIANSFVWQYEKIAYKVKLPSGGVCPAGSIKLSSFLSATMSASWRSI